MAPKPVELPNSGDFSFERGDVRVGVTVSDQA